MPEALSIGQQLVHGGTKVTTSPYANYNTRATPQSESIPGTVLNSAGGYSFPVDDWIRLDRFLILGTEGGTYYIDQKELTKENAAAVQRCIKADGLRVLNRIVEISESGRAARNDPAIFALALCFAEGDLATKHAAKDALPRVCRIGTHLFHFAQYVQNMRGWGPALKKAVANWYDNNQRDLGYQLVKYQQRDGWSHADLIKLSHPKANPDLYNWVLGERPDTEGRKHEPVIKPGATPEHRTIEGFLKLQDIKGFKEAAVTIRNYHLPREAVPTQFLNEPEVWAALLDTDMGYEALVRNLGNMGKVGLLVSLSDASKAIVKRLQDGEALRKAKLHPIKILAGLKTYSSGKGFRGSNEWPIVPQVVDALNDAFYESFKHIEPSGKNLMLGLDVSASMSAGLMNMPYLACNEAAAVLSMVTARVEPSYVVCAFDQGIRDLNISASERLDDVMKKVKNINGGGTDCSLPMLAALEKKLPIEGFAVYTDSETWAGKIHPSQALVQFRQQMGINAKLVVVGMTSNGFSLADPEDYNMLDIVGFDTDTPEIISNFFRGGFGN